MPTETLVEHVGVRGDGDRELVRGLVSRLRAKIEPDPRNPHYIVTVAGIGYTFLEQPAHESLKKPFVKIGFYYFRASRHHMKKIAQSRKSYDGFSTLFDGAYTARFYNFS